MHSSASKCFTRGRRNPRKDSNGIVSGLRMRPLGGGCSFREVAVWFAPPVAAQSAVLTRTYVRSSLRMYCNTEHEYTGSNRYIRYDTFVKGRESERENEDHLHVETHLHSAAGDVPASVPSALSDVGQCSRLRPRLKLAHPIVGGEKERRCLSVCTIHAASDHAEART
ncbi:hypothetical protein ALC60_14548 [Trachymyrmex zeteki]|uniref:Uncharacterized protein n=1 Tax=Mycetomoellerius zeteki TaxID=64791 RepID=A0A151WF52_9HYME|nr:hypothetical protein ALC60_14548 [Trachymyrmex zeteki]